MKADRFLDRPSSPCTTHGAVLSNTNFPSLCIWKIGWLGCICSYNRQNSLRIAFSRGGSGRTSPVKTCQQLLRKMYSIQLRIRSTGSLKDSSWVLRYVFGISKLSFNFFTKIFCESLSEFFSLQRARSTKPPERDAVARPKSLTMFCAVRIAPVHGASA